MVYMLLGTGFEETEAVAPIDLLRRAGVSVATVGIGGKVIVGSHGIPVTADMELGQMDLTQLDMIVLPGDTTADTIAAIIADEAAIGMVNFKTTAVRVIPAIGKKAGEELEFGGLLGTGPIMNINPNSSSKFISRGGQIPAPLQSLKN